MAQWPVRVAVPADAAEVAGLLYDFNVEFDTPTPDREVLADRLTRLLSREDILVLLAGAPTVGVALLTLRPTPWSDGPFALLEELYVVPERRDQGAGTALLLRAIDTCRERGAEEMQINVDEVDTDTRRFYERHGFSNVDGVGGGLMFFYEREL